MLEEKRLEIEGFAKAFKDACKEFGVRLDCADALSLVFENELNGVVDFLDDEENIDVLSEIYPTPESDKIFTVHFNRRSISYKDHLIRNDGNADSEHLLAHALGHMMVHMGFCTDSEKWTKFSKDSPFKDSFISRPSYLDSEEEARLFAELIF